MVKTKGELHYVGGEVLCAQLIEFVTAVASFVFQILRSQSFELLTGNIDTSII